MSDKFASRAVSDICKAMMKRWQDAEPIKHGKWIWRGGNLYECSECGAIVVAQDYIPIELHYFCRGCGARMDESTMGQLKVDVSIKNPTKRWDTCGLTEDSVLVDTGARGEKVEKGEEK